jgi:hypothetical protein
MREKNGYEDAMRRALARKPFLKTARRDSTQREYRFDYRGVKPNRFAAETSKGAVVVVLDPDVAAVFERSGVVNTLLRSVIAAMPESKQQSR